MTTLTVTNLSGDITTSGSLPYVIQQLNTTSGSVVINFSVSGTITLTTALPSICSPATSISIEGPLNSTPPISITIVNNTASPLFNFVTNNNTSNPCGSNLTSISILGSGTSTPSSQNNLTLSSASNPAINFNLTNDSNPLNIMIQNVNFEEEGINFENSASNLDSIFVQNNANTNTTPPIFFNCSSPLNNTNIINNSTIGSINNISNNSNISNNTLTNGSINNTGTTITIDYNMLMGNNGCNISTNPFNPFSTVTENHVTITGNTLQTTGSITIKGAKNPGEDNPAPANFFSRIDQNNLSGGTINIKDIQYSTINNNTLATGDINVSNCFQEGASTQIPATTVIYSNTLNSNNNINLNGTFTNNVIGPKNTFTDGGMVNVKAICGGEQSPVSGSCTTGGGCSDIVDNIFSSTMSSAQEAILIDHTNARIRNNQIRRGYARGITLKKNSQTMVQSNTINALAGIVLTECVECILIDNNISGGGSVQNSPLRDIRAGQVVNAGISIFESTGNKILNNTVGGVFGHAIHFKDSDKKGSTKHFVKGNKIGFDPDGKPNPNTLSGIHCGKKSNSNVAQCNTIAHNGKGITADTPSALNNTFSANSISENASKGIGLTNGANDDQAFPVLNSAQANGNTIIITGTLTSLPNTTFRIEFFRNPVDRGPITEGKDPLGSVVVKTDTNGFVSFTARVLSADTTGFVSSTATVLDGPNTGDTSEFSLNIPITAGGTPQSAIGFAIFKKYCASENPCLDA